LQSKRPELSSTLILLRWLHYHSFVARRRSELRLVLFRDLIRDVETLRAVPAISSLL